MTAACVIGHRVGYSRSPTLHGFWLRTLGIVGRYDLVDIAQADFAGFLTTLSAQGYVGANVTKPHKQAAFALFFENELPALRGAIKRLETNRQGVTELSVLLLLMDLPEQERQAVFAAIVEAMGVKLYWIN